MTADNDLVEVELVGGYFDGTRLKKVSPAAVASEGLLMALPTSIADLRPAPEPASLAFWKLRYMLPHSDDPKQTADGALRLVLDPASMP